MKPIDWKTVPDGVAVMMGKSNGELVCHALDSDVCYVKTTHIATPNIGYKTIRERKAEDLRLAPADQQPWLVYEEGLTVIPEWAKVIYKGISPFFNCHPRGMAQYTTTSPYFDNFSYVAHYKIVGIKDGWADNPEEATE